MVNWTNAEMLGGDTETTGRDPSEARLVTATMAVCGADGAGQPEITEWLADPGIEIPSEAAAIHKVTTEIARSRGRPEREVVAEVLDWLAGHWSPGMPIAFYNAPYDLTLLDRRARAHGLVDDEGLRIRGPVVDALVMNRMHRSTRFRATAREGGRTLVNVSKFYGVPLPETEAHNSTADCLAAVRVARAAGRQHRDLGRMDLRALYVWQRQAARRYATEMQAFLRKKAVEEGKSTPEVEAIVLNGDWPLIPLVDSVTSQEASA